MTRAPRLLAALFAAALLLSACTGPNAAPFSGPTTWDSATWDSAQWE